LLRAEDIRNLNPFFLLARISPGEEIDPEELLSDLRAYADDASVFRGVHARRILGDERLPLAAHQIANAAAQWDGQEVSLDRSRRSVIRLWLAIHTTGGNRVSGGLIKLTPQGKTAEVDGVTLERLLGRSSVREQPAPVAYRPIDERLVIAVRSLLDGRYVEARYVRPGDYVAIAQPLSSDPERVARELMRIAVGERVDSFKPGTAGLPNSWNLYRLRLREGLAQSEVPGFLEKCVKLAGVRLRVSGGLRVRGAWIEGAGPTLSVCGGDAETVIVDGKEYELRDGFLHPEWCPTLNALGVHEACLPGRHSNRVRFRVVRPRAARFPTPVVDAGWVWAEPPVWPGRLTFPISGPDCRMRGPVIEGDWPAAERPAAFALPEQAAVILAVAIRRPLAAGSPARLARLKEQNEQHPNLLVRQLARAVRPGAPARQG